MPEHRLRAFVTGMNTGMTSGQYQNSDGAVAYIMSRFPKVTETFILREILELERQGQELVILPLIRERQDVVHPEVEQVKSPVHYTPVISWQIIKANLYYLSDSPILYLKTLGEVLAGNWGSANLFFGALAVFPKSVYFAKFLSRTNVRHIHAHFATHPALSAFIVSKLTGLGFSFTVHAHDIFVHSAMLGQKLEAADFVASISAFNKRYISDRFPDARPKIKVVHCGICPENYGAEITGEADRPLQSFRLLSVASLQTYKGIEYLIRACSLLVDVIPGLRCTVIGEGADRNRLERLIADLGLQKVIGLVGAKSQSEVAAELSRADLFVLPSVVAPDGQMEGIPVALMEAMASRLPVISTEISGIPELVGHGESGLLVPPADADALSKAIAELYRLPDLRKRMGIAGKRVVESEFDLRTNVKKLRELFERSLDAKGAAKKTSRKEITAIEDVLDAKVISASPASAAGRDSEVMLLTVRSNKQIDEEVAVKFHRPANASNGSNTARDLFHAENEYRALRRLWPEFRDPNGLCIPKPLALISEQAAVVTERCSGIRLDHLIRYRAASFFSDDSELVKVFETVGMWLSKFHSVTGDGRSAEEALDRLRGEFAQDMSVCRKLSFAPSLLDKVEEHFERNGRIIEESHGEVVSEHCDFGPHNIFVDGEKITLIDFEGIRDGFIYGDLSYFLCLVDLMPSYHLNGRQKVRLKDAFLRGYGSQHKIADEVLQFYAVPTLIKLAAHNPVFFEARSTTAKLRARMQLRAYTKQLKESVGG